MTRIIGAVVIAAGVMFGINGCVGQKVGMNETQTAKCQTGKCGGNKTAMKMDGKEGKCGSM